MDIQTARPVGQFAWDSSSHHRVPSPRLPTWDATVCPLHTTSSGTGQVLDLQLVDYTMHYTAFIVLGTCLCVVGTQMRLQATLPKPWQVNTSSRNHDSETGPNKCSSFLHMPGVRRQTL